MISDAPVKKRKTRGQNIGVIWAALTIIVVLVVPLPALANTRSMIQWGGTMSAGAEAVIDEGDGRVDARGSLRLQLRTLTYPWRVFYDGRIYGTGALDGSGLWEADAVTDRLYVRFYSPFADLTLGRQFVNWGVGYAWSPTDVFNPPDPTDPQGLRQGIDAAVVQGPVGPLGYWTVAWADERFGVRRRGFASGIDWSVAAVLDGADTVFGVDLKGDWGVGWHTALAHRMPDEAALGTTTTWLIGADYSWLAGDLIWVGEYWLHWQPDTTVSSVSQTYQQLTYRLDELTSLAGSLLAPLPGGVRWWNVSYHTVLSAQSQLNLSLAFPLEKARWSIDYSYSF